MNSTENFTLPELILHSLLLMGAQVALNLGLGFILSYLFVFMNLSNLLPFEQYTLPIITMFACCIGYVNIYCKNNILTKHKIIELALVISLFNIVLISIVFLSNDFFILILQKIGYFILPMLTAFCFALSYWINYIAFCVGNSVWNENVKLTLLQKINVVLIAGIFLIFSLLISIMSSAK